MKPAKSLPTAPAAFGHFFVAALIALLAARTSPAQAAPEPAVQPTTVAVFPFASAKPIDPELGPNLADLTGTHLSNADQLLTVERAEIDKALGEMELGMSGAVAPEHAAQAGSLLGAQVLVTGRLIRSGEDLQAIVKVIGTNTGRVFAFTEPLPRNAKPDAAAQSIARQIEARITQDRAALVGAPVTAESLIAALQPKLQGKKLPSVHVAITEQHLSRAVPDPAAETEVKKILAALGFRVLDEKADVTLTGEAFSELGMRKGNLVSCRARVETKVADSRDPAASWVDRETAGAVDLAENIAAKSALQSAGLRIAERFALRYAAAGN